MSDDSASTLSRVLEQLVDIYGAIREKKAVESAVIQDCKTLLKPWPKKKKKNKTVQDDTQGVVKDKEKGKEKEDMEAMILDEVQLMLAKAQKARDILAKTDQENGHKTKGATAQKQESRILSKERRINNQSVETKSEQHDRNETSQSGVISQSDLKKLLELPKTSTKPAVPNKKVGATGLPNKDISKRVVETELKHLNSKLSKVKIASAVRNHYSTSSSEIGKYSKRPSSKVTSSYSQKSLSAKSANERTRISAAKTSKQHPIRTGATNTIKQHTMRGNRTAHNAEVLARKIIKSAPSHIQVGNDESSRLTSGEHHTVTDDVKKESSKPTERSRKNVGNVTVKNESNSQDDEEVDVNVEEDEPPFLLITDGTKLSFPLHFRRLHNTQEVLINKVSEVISRSEPTAACQHFIERVNSKLLGRTEESFSLYEHDMRYDKLKKEYEQLNNTADQQLLALHQAADDSSWQDLYQIKVNMELIHNRSQQLLTEIQDFEKNEVQYCDIIERAKSKLGVTSSTNNLPSTYFLPQKSQDVIEDIYPHRLSPVKIEYSNVDELQRLVGLQLELQALQVEHQIQKLLSEEMLPILAAMDKEDPEFIQCYRSLYGLLCHRGEQFPTIIVDDVDENEVLSDDD